MTAAKPLTASEMKKPPHSYGPQQLADHLRLGKWEMEQGKSLGIIPEPDYKGRWSAAVAADLLARREEIVAAAGEPPIGANRCAQRLAERLGLPVQGDDITALAAAGHLAAAGEYKGYALYAARDVDALEAALVAPIVSEREDWNAASIRPDEAAEQLGWRREELERALAEHGIERGRDGRIPRQAMAAIAADDELGDAIAADRRLGPEQASEHLEIRRTDFQYLVEGGLLATVCHVSRQVGRYTYVEVPLYRTGDLDALRDHPWIDWEELWATPAGAPSPLREWLRRAPRRSEVVHRFAAEVRADFSVEVWTWYHGAGGWEIDWERDENGGPSVAQVKAMLDADTAMAPYASHVQLSSQAGAAIRWARAMLEPGAAVIVDTETTDLFGRVIEIAVIDAATGATLLDTLVNPGVPIEPGAQAVHGLRDADVADAPTWAKVLPKLRKVTKGRQIIAYNADYDQTVILRDTHHAGLKPLHLDDDARWSCAMQARSDHARSWRWMPLGGGHRALGDAKACRDVLLHLTTAPTVKGTRRR
ncbi:3'-5' exonuclease [Phytomonospora sp. NPDC050363]|uniref:3'-5' exonuclease n=1 Tax=Phytomonospora sp. NPDC050363 TaxID=3155642 RepID=UPI0033CD1C71